MENQMVETWDNEMEVGLIYVGYSTQGLMDLKKTILASKSSLQIRNSNPNSGLQDEGSQLGLSI